jgi:hypothetical protein
MNNDKLLKNAEIAGADLSVFHAPDRKWKNYYYEDEKQNLLFLVPSYLFYGIIVVDLDWAKKAKFTTEDGAIHMFKDYTWNMTSNNRKTSYVKTTVTDRSIKCGRKTIILGLLVLNRLFLSEESPDRNAVLYLNGNTLDNRMANLSFGAIKENNVNKYKNVSEIEYPCKIWW